MNLKGTEAMNEDRNVTRRCGKGMEDNKKHDKGIKDEGLKERRERNRM